MVTMKRKKDQQILCGSSRPLVVEDDVAEGEARNEIMNDLRYPFCLWEYDTWRSIEPP